MTIHWKAVEQYFTVVPVLFVFHQFGKFISFGLKGSRVFLLILGELPPGVFCQVVPQQFYGCHLFTWVWGGGGLFER